MTVDELIINNLKLIPYTMKLLNCNYRDEDDYEEIYFAGLLGLIEGAKNYDINKPFNSSYFVLSIKYSIMNRIFVKRTQKAYFDYKKITKSLNMKIKDDEDTELIELISSDYDINEELFKLLDKQELYKNINKLKPNHKSIITKRFGLENGIEMTIEEIANSLGISRQAANEKYRRAIKKLKKIYVEK